VILVDANLLIYAVDRDSPYHDAARSWLEATFSGTTRVGLAWIVILAFLRITTRGDVFRRPLSVDQALAYIDSWLRQPFVRPVAPAEGHWPLLRTLMTASGTAGNLTSDAHLAALALEHGCAIYSTDHDFRRFRGVEHVNPIA
jgi:toxin-antitoxin system PIN domain toxin